MIVRDQGGVFAEVVDFIHSFTNEYDTRRLATVELKETHGRHYYSGVCKYPPKRTRNKPFHIICRVSKYNLSCNRFPLTVKETIGTRKYDLKDSENTVSGQGWSYIEEEVTFYDQDEVMAFVFGHELWHFLCKTKQKSGNWQTKANKFGIEVLEEFRRWRGELATHRMIKGWP